ncbi:MAG: iron ABC transporter substrate-binding protein [Rickettsiales bacterium]|nr:iron ABC transporter substrate-binding protein [Rickettsiales bacterium]|tara:strand:- start:137 stop:1216 length:1080 start_codon:yes stop_codon:yes gene_type:complete
MRLFRSWNFCVLQLTLLSLLCLSSCQQDTASTEPQPAQPASDKAAPEPAESKRLVVYSGRGAVLVEPLLETFTKQSGIQVDVRYEKSTETLANRIASEGAQTKADLFFAQDSGWLGALGAGGHLSNLPEATLAKVPEHHRDAAGNWVATSGRARVLVYSPERVQAEDLPKTLAELPQMAGKARLGWAPGNGSYQAHVSALRHIWGEDKTRTWLTAMKAAEPIVYPKNSPQVKAVSNGEIEVGWVNHYYLHKLRAANPELQAANYSFPSAGDAGNLMMLSGVAIVAHSNNQDAAQKLVDFLLSDTAQSYFANQTFEYPTVAGIALHKDVPPIDANMVRADQTHLTDLSGTLTLLRDLGLQ